MTTPRTPKHEITRADIMAPADYAAAQRAGIAYLHAQWGYGPLPGGDCPVVTRFGEILEAI